MKIGILGSGVYAKAISNVLLQSDCSVIMWTEKEDLKDVVVQEGTFLTNSFEEVTRDTEVIFVLTGSQFVKSVLQGIAPFIEKNTLVVLGSKGILEDGTFPLELVEEILPNNPYAIISGPTFAVDIASLEPVGFTIGTAQKTHFEILKKCLKTVYLEHSEDTLAIEMCGSLKNAYAIGSGLLSGSNFGHSTMCLYITKVLKEMSGIFAKMGANSQSVSTLAGVGDLVLTCTSEGSRNFTFGTILALGNTSEKESYLKTHTVEGYENLKAYVALFAKKNIEAPILNCVYKVVEGTLKIDDFIKLLLK